MLTARHGSLTHYSLGNMQHTTLRLSVYSFWMLYFVSMLQFTLVLFISQPLFFSQDFFPSSTNLVPALGLYDHVCCQSCIPELFLLCAYFLLIVFSLLHPQNFPRSHTYSAYEVTLFPYGFPSQSVLVLKQTSGRYQGRATI